jgi:Domain of unknown function (DUF4438)
MGPGADVPVSPLSHALRQADRRPTPRGRSLAVNHRELVAATVLGQIAHPVGRATAYRIGQDGAPRVLPGTGGITLNFRIGDPCVGLAGDHIEPGVSLHNNDREVIGLRAGPNLALMTYACVGNRARVTTGPCTGATGLVTGKHGGVNHVMVDFPTEVLARLRIGDRMQITSIGLGLRLTDWPELAVSNCAPELLRRMGLRVRRGRLVVPVTHLVPGALIGSGLGKDTVWRGDFDIQLFDPVIRRRYRLDRLRFGDLVLVRQIDARFGPAWRGDRATVGVIVHGDSTVSGHGPGVCPLLTGPATLLTPRFAPHANLAVLFGVRRLDATERQAETTAWRRLIAGRPAARAISHIDR